MSDDTALDPAELAPAPKRSPETSRAQPLKPDSLMAVVRFLAQHTERVIFGDHAQERMDERGITDSDVYAVLRFGEIKGNVTPGALSGEWKCKVVAKLRGSRQIGAVIIVIMNEQLFVKTVEWEDR